MSRFIGANRSDNKLAILSKVDEEYQLDIKTFDETVMSETIFTNLYRTLDPEKVKYFNIYLMANFIFDPILTDEDIGIVYTEKVIAADGVEYIIFLTIHDAFIHFQRSDIKILPLEDDKNFNSCCLNLINIQIPESFNKDVNPEDIIDEKVKKESDEFVACIEELQDFRCKLQEKA